MLSQENITGGFWGKNRNKTTREMIAIEGRTDNVPKKKNKISRIEKISMIDKINKISA